MTIFSEFDRLAMSRALALAEQGLETTHPNPRVGCVIAKADCIIAEGWHERAGEAHAEIAALRAAKEPVAGATAYVTLEPCSHHGRTPPCVNALIEARLARVVFAVQDPNPRVSGQGAEALSRAGIAVEAGLMEAEATELNVGFMKRMKQGLPWVRVKLAMSLDGRTALANGRSQWITGEHARNDVQRWRARSSAVMTGIGTLLADDPQLDVRTDGFRGRQPLRAVLDAQLRSPPGSKMFVGLDGTGARAVSASTAAGASTALGAPVGEVLIFAADDGGPRADSAHAVAATDMVDDATWAGAALSGAVPVRGAGTVAAAFEARRAALLAGGVRIEEVPSEGGFLDLRAVLLKLAELEVNEVLVEAGPTLAGQLLTTFLVDEILLYIAPKLLGPQGRPLISLPQLDSLQDAWGFSLFEAKRFGDDLRLRLRPK